MQVILKQDVQGLGYKNDIVKVRAGYGRNYLIPNGLALIANDSNKRLTTENVRQAAHKAAKLKQDAEALAAKIGELVIEIGTKAGESGKIFGAVTALQVADVLKSKGFDIDRKKVQFKEQPKQLGTFAASLELHKEVKHEIKVKVIAE
ncbi:50S ribosomal protein L9 [Oscillatoria amoena NRMC-F 0135]|nr:50S ribosomal protein L9 [Oscillatoria amoena NRMC-F 0135]